MELKPLKMNVDRRGLFVEAFKTASGQVSYVIAEPNETRGNHYHTRKTESFLVIDGSAVICVKDRTTNNVMKVETSGGNPMVVTVAPNHTHNITPNYEGCIFLLWCDELFNEGDPDTYPEEI